MPYTPSAFEDFYQEKTEDWLQDPTINSIQILKNFYKNCFDSSGHINYSAIKNGLMLPRDTQNKKLKKEAREMFLNLFAMSHVTTGVVRTDALNNISAQFGERIVAHGVEESKGGMLSLLMMAISNQVHTPEEHFGPLIEGAPSSCSLIHGPYYLIYDMPPLRKATPPHYPALTDIEYILVPFQKNIDMLRETLGKLTASTCSLMTQNQADVFESKLITYDGFYAMLNPNLTFFQPKRKPSSSDEDNHQSKRNHLDKAEPSDDDAPSPGCSS